MTRISTILIVLVCFSCSCSNDKEETSGNEKETEVIIKKRPDGTISSVNQIDTLGMVHGMRITYYADGKTIYSKLKMKHGFKHGPSNRYYKNGQIYEYSNFLEGKRHGLTKKYRKNGDLLSECEYENGNPKPGLKEYREDGALVTSYPEISFREINQLKTKNRVELEIFCPKMKDRVKFYLREPGGKISNKIYLITEDGLASQRFYIEPGETLDKELIFLAEISTNFKNVMVKEIPYHLQLSNK